MTFWGQQLDVAPFFSAADAFIMSSKSEGLPISLLQAFSLGLPAIVTDVGGMAEVVRLAEAGYTVLQQIPPRWPRRFCAWQAATRNGSNSRRTQKRHSDRALRLQTMVDAYMDLYRNTPRSGKKLRPETGTLTRNRPRSEYRGRLALALHHIMVRHWSH